MRSERAVVRDAGSGGRGSAGEGLGSLGPGINTNWLPSIRRGNSQMRSARASKCPAMPTVDQIC
eukprot:1182421-Prorocentrum_minimum.AAC.5